MEPVTLILAALTAGASAGALDALKDDAKDKAKAAYAKLQGLVKKRVSAGRTRSWRWRSTTPLR